MLLMCLASSDGAGATRQSASDHKAQAAKLVKTVGCQGGLVVHLGSGDGAFTAALRTGNGYLVQGLDTDRENVGKAQAYVRSLGIYGQVSVDSWDGKSLPYADNLVNLLVAEDPQEVSRGEMMRVLAPGGTLCVPDEGRWVPTVKPWPDDVDQWTHHLHDAGNNAVAKDTVVGPPKHMQWTAGPVWARSHGWTPSVSGMVSAGGRLFYICDETLTGVDASVPDKWTLTARDAFSGVLLWKQEVTPWGAPAFSGTLNTGRPVTTGRFTMPPHVGKRIVAVGDTVYVTLGADAAVTALDAATGQTRMVYRETAHADEILHVDNRLVISLNQPGSGMQRSKQKQVCALDPETGQVLWKKGPFTGIWSTRGQDPSGRLELAAGDGRVFMVTEDSLVSLDLQSGQTVWQVDRPQPSADADRRIGFAGVYEFRLTVMVYHDGVVLLAQPEPNAPHSYHTMPGTLRAFDAENGRLLWKQPYGGWGHCTPPDVFVIDDLVWTHEHVLAEFSPAPANGFRAANPAEVDYAIQAFDLKTGQRKNHLLTKEVFNVGHHHRCYRNKITERFMMASRRGVEFVDLSSGENYLHHWVRSGCLLGNLPCNGLLYVAPHPCGCYIEAKLTGFNALAAQRKTENGKPKPAADDPSRLERGPGYGQNIQPSSFGIRHSNDWPSYRHDAGRSGSTQTTVAAELAPLWTSKIGGRTSGVVVAEGKLFAADVDGHAVHALDAADGQAVWQFTAAARVDSPPTIYRGMAIFGSADGHVYCLRASDGTLIWRFRAAPEERRVIAFDQLESPWPVAGSVLMHQDKCWFAAGRSSYLDGGIHLFALDPASGRVMHEETIYSPDPETGKMPLSEAHTMPGVLNDVLASDGSSVFIRQMNVSSPGESGRRHLFTSGGYLDSSWFNRTLWKIGGLQSNGIMVLGEDVVYGVDIYGGQSREAVFKPGAQGYRLACRSLSERAPAAAVDQAGRRGKLKPGPKVLWQKQVPIRITSMVRAADKLFVAGSPDVVDPEDPHGAWEGRKGGLLAVFDAASGRMLTEIKLRWPPVWDGMAVAGRSLFVATMNGEVVCLGDADGT